MERVRLLNQRTPRVPAKYVLYWAQMNRRADSNHALSFAVAQADAMRLPVLFYEGLTCSYPYASDRLHTFLFEGIPSTARRLQDLGIGYCFHLRERRDDPNDALYALAREAAMVVTDDYPVFVAARHNASVPARIDIPYYAVDSSCVVPMCRIETKQYAAYTIRPRIRRLLPEYLQPVAEPRPRRRWRLPAPKLHNPSGDVARCEIDHSVPPSTCFRGGRAEGLVRLERFLEHNLRRYARHRNEPSAHATSNLSPYLHFGHVSSLEIALAVKEHARESKLIADEFLEELIVRRELAFNHARFADPPDSLEALPEWARSTLRKHARDRREASYRREQFERAGTHDALWNATQNELLLRGTIHGYYRMYWGKKIIEWSRDPEEALATMVYLHDRYALDGRDPNTYANILWCFGLHDRPWKTRPIFGSVRYLSLEGMKRKTDIAAYLGEIEAIGRGNPDPLRIQ